MHGSGGIPVIICTYIRDDNLSIISIEYSLLYLWFIKPRTRSQLETRAHTLTVKKIYLGNAYVYIYVETELDRRRLT
jgi:hypothetical protein